MFIVVPDMLCGVFTNFARKFFRHILSRLLYLWKIFFPILSNTFQYFFNTFSILFSILCGGGGGGEKSIGPHFEYKGATIFNTFSILFSTFKKPKKSKNVEVVEKCGEYQGSIWVFLIFGFFKFLGEKFQKNQVSNTFQYFFNTFCGGSES
jgi:hypothetical protein